MKWAPAVVYLVGSQVRLTLSVLGQRLENCLWSKLMQAGRAPSCDWEGGKPREPALCWVSGLPKMDAAACVPRRPFCGRCDSRTTAALSGGAPECGRGIGRPGDEVRLVLGYFIKGALVLLEKSRQNPVEARMLGPTLAKGKFSKSG